MRDWFGLTVRPSGVTHALHRAARQAAPTYVALRDQILGSPVVSPDETSWKVGGRLWWLWVFATAHTVVYAIQDGRGFDDAAAVLGAEFDGILVRDGWAPYRQFHRAAHQTCLAHLMRRCREIAEAHPRTPWPRHVKAVLQDALDVRDRVVAGDAKRLYKPFAVADVKEDLRIPMAFVWAVPKDPRRSSNTISVGAPIERIVLESKEDESAIVQPETFSTEDLEWKNLLGGVVEGNSAVATFPLDAIKRLPTGEFDVVVITPNGERRCKVGRNDRARVFP